MHSQYLGKDTIVGFAEHTTEEVQVHELLAMKKLRDDARTQKPCSPQKASKT